MVIAFRLIADKLKQLRQVSIKLVVGGTSGTVGSSSFVFSGEFIVSYSQARAQSRPPTVDLVSIQCPHCSTPFARIARPKGGPLAVCLACGVSGDYVTLVEKGALTGLNLGQQEIQRLRFAITALRDQAARVELGA